MFICWNLSIPRMVALLYGTNTHKMCLATTYFLDSFPFCYKKNSYVHLFEKKKKKKE